MVGQRPRGLVLADSWQQADTPGRRRWCRRSARRSRVRRRSPPGVQASGARPAARPDLCRTAGGRRGWPQTILWSATGPRRRRPGPHVASFVPNHLVLYFPCLLPAWGDGEDLDAFLASANLPSHQRPLPVVPHHGCFGPLGGDEQDVRELLPRHQRRQAQALGPVDGSAQRHGALPQPGAERGQLASAVFVPVVCLGRFALVRDAGITSAEFRAILGMDAAGRRAVAGLISRARRAEAEGDDSGQGSSSDAS